MRNKLIVANWKMHHSVEESLKFMTRYARDVRPSATRDIVICPPFTSLYSMSVLLGEIEGGPALGAQNCHWEDQGAFTGETSVVFLKELGCQYVIVGHSERRHLFGETDAMVGKKVNACLAHQLTPIFCIGETLAQKDEGKTLEVIARQLEVGLKEVQAMDQWSKIVVAYEPVWAIGTGRNLEAPGASEIHRFIRGWLGKKTNVAAAEQIRILYGGSVRPQNIASFMSANDVDGALVGGASLTVDSFSQIIKE